MRHQRLKRKLGIKSPHRKALLRNLVRELIMRKRIRTTHARAKEASAFADKMISIAKKGNMHARRQLVSKLRATDAVATLVKDIAPHFKDRPGGYTRVLRLKSRPGDNSDMALLEFTALIESPENKTKKKKKSATKKKTKKADSTVAPEAKETKKKSTGAAKADSADKSKDESEKKGGFLGTLRKFLKGSE